MNRHAQTVAHSGRHQACENCGNHVRKAMSRINIELDSTSNADSGAGSTDNLAYDQHNIS